jgi:hypothetical protein
VRDLGVLLTSGWGRGEDGGVGLGGDLAVGDVGGELDEGEGVAEYIEDGEVGDYAGETTLRQVRGGCRSGAARRRLTS